MILKIRANYVPKKIHHICFQCSKFWSRWTWERNRSLILSLHSCRKPSKKIFSMQKMKWIENRSTWVHVYSNNLFHCVVHFFLNAFKFCFDQSHYIPELIVPWMTRKHYRSTNVMFWTVFIIVLYKNEENWIHVTITETIINYYMYIVCVIVINSEIQRIYIWYNDYYYYNDAHYNNWRVSLIRVSVACDHTADIEDQQYISILDVCLNLVHWSERSNGVLYVTAFYI